MAVKHRATRPGLLEENKKNKKAKSFFPLNFNVYINLDNGERARAKKKIITTETNFIGRKT